MTLNVIVNHHCAFQLFIVLVEIIRFSHCTSDQLQLFPITALHFAHVEMYLKVIIIISSNVCSRPNTVQWIFFFFFYPPWLGKFELGLAWWLFWVRSSLPRMSLLKCDLFFLISPSIESCVVLKADSYTRNVCSDSLPSWDCCLTFVSSLTCACYGFENRARSVWYLVSLKY